MLRSHQLCCMALHIEKTCEVRSFGDLGRCVLGVWQRCKLLNGVIPGFRCLAAFGVGRSQVSL